MELFLLLIYFVSIVALYQSLQNTNDSDFNDEDPGEYNISETL